MRTFDLAVLISLVLTIFPISAAHSQTTGIYLVPQGCGAPEIFHGNIYYIDPVHGKITNSGTATAPWDTLQNVMSKKQSLFKSGDVINLMSGNHGSVTIVNMINSNFIKIQAAAGQAPVLNSLTIHGGQNLVIQGLKIQSLKTTLVTIDTSYTKLISKNIIFYQ